jgi:hypothetical protein
LKVFKRGSPTIEKIGTSLPRVCEEPWMTKQFFEEDSLGELLKDLKRLCKGGRVEYF